MGGAAVGPEGSPAEPGVLRSGPGASRPSRDVRPHPMARMRAFNRFLWRAALFR